jgi:transglutaminase-like putative cysteine protease
MELRAFVVPPVLTPWQPHTSLHRVKYTVRHVTRYDYGRPIDLGAHMMHLRPRDLPWQRVISASLTPKPAPGRTENGIDCFGNHISWMFMDTPHQRFEVALDAEVDVATPVPPPADHTPPWTDVARAAASGGVDVYEAAEFLFESPLVGSLAEAASYAAPSFPPQRPILTAVLDLNQRIRRDFKFRGGVTSVSTTVRQVLAQRAGVCQDFSHLMVAALRGLGLPARYVSGYVRTWPPAGQPRRIGADQSHAWVGAWLGPAHGWVDVDPTNGLVVADEHVVLGWGRDFTDITPLCGVILGGGSHRVHVSVDLAPSS